MKEFQIIKTQTLSDNWYKLDKITFQYENDNKETEILDREIYRSSNGITILLYNRKKGTVILTKQFRLATYVNGNSLGMLIEACAGILEDEDPEEGIRREAEEETGYKLIEVKKVFEAYMAPGSVTEKLHFFIAEYDDKRKIAKGGGLEEEQEEIDVQEESFEEALKMISTGAIMDAKTIMLLQYLKLNKLMDINPA